jgi:hypothetical protein
MMISSRAVRMVTGERGMSGGAMSVRSSVNLTNSGRKIHPVKSYIVEEKPVALPHNYT